LLQSLIGAGESVPAQGASVPQAGPANLVDPQVDSGAVASEQSEMDRVEGFACKAGGA